MEREIFRLLECQVHQRGAAGKQGMLRRSRRWHAVALPGWPLPAEGNFLIGNLVPARHHRRGARSISAIPPRRVPWKPPWLRVAPAWCTNGEPSVQSQEAVRHRRAVYAGDEHLPACLFEACRWGSAARAARLPGSRSSGVRICHTSLPPGTSSASASQAKASQRGCRGGASHGGGGGGRGWRFSLNLSSRLPAAAATAWP